MSSDLKTRCQYCNTAFRVTDRQLVAASGMVRCGVCFKAFNAIRGLLDPLPEELAHRFPAAKAPPKAALTARDDDDDFYIDDNFDLSKLDALVEKTDELRPASRQQPAQRPQTKTASPTTRPSAPATPPQTGKAGRPQPSATGPKNVSGAESKPDTLPGATQSFAASKSSSAPPHTQSQPFDESELAVDTATMADWRPDAQSLIATDEEHDRAAAPAPRHRWLWRLGVVAALVVLAGQLLYFNSLGIPRGSALWPATETFCNQLGCPLTPAADTSKILSTDLVIRTHPDISNALLVDAVVVNTADFSQPYPALTLVFENLQGEVVARRTFRPSEYLYGDLAEANMMPVKQAVKLEMEIVDPGKHAVSFRLLVAD